jgi:hypothetical protein
LFEEHGFIGGVMRDSCSKELKRVFGEKWCKANCNPHTILRVFGIHWSEADRFYRVDRKTGNASGIWPRMQSLGWPYVRAPMCEEPFVSNDEMKQWVKDAGLWEQKLYQLGFPHANCGGECVKQGQGGWKLLYETMPDRFIKRMEWEQKMREKHGNISIMREHIPGGGGERRPLPLAVLKERIDAGKECDSAMGGCSCFAGQDDYEPEVVQ